MHDVVDGAFHEFSDACWNDPSGNAVVPTLDAFLWTGDPGKLERSSGVYHPTR